MSIKLSIKKNLNEKLVKNYFFFTYEDFKIIGLNKLQVSKFSKEIDKTINSNDLKNKEFLSFNLNPTQKIILIKIKKNQSSLDNEKIGAKFYDFINPNSYYKISFEENINLIYQKSKYFFDEFMLGLKLKSYAFDKYKSKRSDHIFEIEMSKESSLILIEIKIQILIEVQILPRI